MSRLSATTMNSAVELVHLQRADVRAAQLAPCCTLLHPLLSAPRVRLGAAFRLVAFLCVSGLPAVSPAGGCGFVYVVQSLRVQREEEALEDEDLAL